MERFMDSAIGVIVFYLSVAMLTFVVTLCMKENNKKVISDDVYVAYSETTNLNL